MRTVACSVSANESTVANGGSCLIALTDTITRWSSSGADGLSGDAANVIVVGAITAGSRGRHVDGM
ncbi:MAG: hypothetical protein KGN00_11480 [Chloroflexota bacterium]|nr:hypothetical protein [Chloroflexota bacterium]